VDHANKNSDRACPVRLSGAISGTINAAFLRDVSAAALPRQAGQPAAAMTTRSLDSARKLAVAIAHCNRIGRATKIACIVDANTSFCMD
jgi:hypothetical protein